MFEIDKNLQNTILLYILFCIVIYKNKHRYFFKKNGEFKSFGIGENKTIIPYWLVCIVFGLVIYLVISVKNDDFV